MCSTRNENGTNSLLAVLAPSGGGGGNNLAPGGPAGVYNPFHQIGAHFSQHLGQGLPGGPPPPELADEDDAYETDASSSTNKTCSKLLGTLPFLDDELKPSPIVRKRKKQMVMEECKDDKYWERRRKNNMAAKRSRDARRAKENQIAIRASFLERENKALAQELSKARADNHLLRERLCKYEVV